MAKHEVTGQVMRQLVHRRGGKPVPCMKAADKAGREQYRAVVMNGGISEVGGDGIPAVRRVNALEVLRYLVKSFVPADALPTVRSAADGMPEPIFVVVKILQSNGLRADVAAAERIVFVTADVETLA